MSERVNVLIVEDDNYWCNYLEIALERMGHTVAGIARNLEEAVTAVNSIDFDVALVDIAIDGKKSGIIVGKLINSTLKKPFIFITSDVAESIMDDVMAASPAAYLGKPVSTNALTIAINNALNTTAAPGQIVAPPAQNDECFFVKQGTSFKKIYWADVVCLSVSQNYTQVRVKDSKNTYIIGSSLQKTLENVVPKNLHKNFVRISRAEVINTTFVEEVNGNVLLTKFGSFEVTAGNMQDIRKQLHLVF